MQFLTIFSTSITDEVRMELLKTQRELLRHKTVIENYTAAVQAAEARIVRLQKFLADHEKHETTDLVNPTSSGPSAPYLFLKDTK